MWHVFGGSTRGRSHLANDSACQDFSAWRIPSGGLCIAVADGAGSRPRSAAGARAAVESVLGWSEERFSGGRYMRPLEEAFHRARAGVLELAEREQCKPEEYASTLAVALADATSVRIGQLGDSIGVVARPEGKIEAVSPARRSEYVNDTVFLTDELWQSDLRLTRFPLATVTGLALSTDGLQFKILADVVMGWPYLPFFRDLFDWASKPRGGSAGLLEYLDDLDDDQTDDDKTLVVAIRTGPDPPISPPVEPESPAARATNGAPPGAVSPPRAGETQIVRWLA